MRLLCLFLCAAFCLSGEVIPTRTLEVVNSHAIDSDTWVVFDVDMTLIVPKETILWGGAYEQLVAMARRTIPDFEEKQASYYRNIIMEEAKWMLIEETSPQLVASLQEKGATVIALTAMEYEFSDWRVNHLLGFGLDFSNAPKTDFYCYKKGVLFSDNTPKGEVLLSFFNHLGVKPKKVIFFDDSRKFIDSVESELTKAGISVTCYHYQEIDHRPIHFIPAKVREKMRTLFAEGRWPE